MRSYAPWSRRDFLKTVGMTGVGSIVSTLPGPTPLQAMANLPLATRPFGKTGIQVPILALGGTFNTLQNQIILKMALHQGITYWDTADCYENGNSEIGIGQFFKKYPNARQKIFLVSKSDARDPKGLDRLLAQSLKRLQTDTIDLYLIHGIADIQELTPATKKWAAKAKAAGKIKLFGFSTHKNMAKCLQAAARLDWIDGIMTTYNYRLTQNVEMQAALNACAQAGIGLTAMKTQGGGQSEPLSGEALRLTGKFMAQGLSGQQAKLMAVWQHPLFSSLCSLMPNMQILQSNLAAAQHQPSHPQLSQYTENVLTESALANQDHYCAGCAELCEQAMPGCIHIPISDTLRYLMYSRQYGEHEKAVRFFKQLPPANRVMLGKADFRAAEARCPQRLPIRRLMAEAVALLG